MIDIEQLTKELRTDEGVKPMPYRDTVGKLTIGVGRNLDDRGLSNDEIDYLLKNDIRIVCEELDKRLPWWRRMSAVRQRVLANMAFNMGINVLLTFRNTLAAMQGGRYDDAAVGMLASKWAKQVGKRAIRLSEMMKKGV